MKRTTSTRKSASAKPMSDIDSITGQVVSYLQTHAKSMDKATLAKYVAIALVVIYGIRKSNVLGSLAISIITGLVSKYMADKLEGYAIADLIPAGVSK